MPATSMRGAGFCEGRSSTRAEMSPPEPRPLLPISSANFLIVGSITSAAAIAWASSAWALVNHEPRGAWTPQYWPADATPGPVLYRPDSVRIRAKDALREGRGAAVAVM